MPVFSLVLRGRRSEVENEKLRWKKQALDIHKTSETQFIHVVDREADAFDLFDCLISAKAQFIVRICHDRKLKDGGKLFDELSDIPAKYEREITLSARAKSSFPVDRRIHPERKRSKIKVKIGATSLKIKRSHNLKQGSEELSLRDVLLNEAFGDV